MSEQGESKACESCDGEGMFWMMSEFPVPCSKCEGSGRVPKSAEGVVEK